MYCASFIFQPGTYDAEFHRLNALIDVVAKATSGYIGVESWQADDGARRCVNYYWTDLGALKAFSIDPVHQEAKRAYARWYDGYHIVVSEVLRSYGDGRLAHITPNGPSQLAVGPG